MKNRSKNSTTLKFTYFPNINFSRENSDGSSALFTSALSSDFPFNRAKRKNLRSPARSLSFSILFSASTRVIKANGPDIGRKVKVKATGRTIPSPSNSRHRESTSIPTSGSQPRLSSSYKSVANNLPPARNQPEKKVSDIMRRPLKYVQKNI